MRFTETSDGGPRLARMFRFAVCSVLSSIPLFAAPIQPTEPFDYASMAFYPKRWVENEVNEVPMVAWKGEHVALVTMQQDLDAEAITKFVGHLDRGWELYENIVGQAPKPLKQHGEHVTICALPKSNLSCGYGCGYVGATGIEMIDFYNDHLPASAKNPDAVPHAYFYEMGRNYFVFGDRHNCFTTGFAVFMRYVCMDELEIADRDTKTRETIDKAIEIYEADKSLDFIGTFTTHGDLGEKGNRLKDKNGRTISPTDQNVMYASLLLKLRNDYGGVAFVRELYHQLRTTTGEAAKDKTGALKQCTALLICASLAADTDLTPLFTDSYRLPLSKEAREGLAKVDWSNAELTAGEVISQLPKEIAMGVK